LSRDARVSKMQPQPRARRTDRRRTIGGKTSRCGLPDGEQSVPRARWARERGNLFAADAGTGEKVTEAPGVSALRLNEKFLALEMAGVV
jgi:hypothetical protein